MSAAKDAGVFTVIPERKPLSNMRFSRRQVTLRPFTFVDPPGTVSPITTKQKKSSNHGKVSLKPSAHTPDISTYRKPSKHTPNVSTRRKPSKHTPNVSSRHKPSKDTPGVNTHCKHSDHTVDINSHHKPSENTVDVTSCPKDRSTIQTCPNEESAQDNVQHRDGRRPSSEDNETKSQNERSGQIVQRRDASGLSTQDNKTDSDHDASNDTENSHVTVEPVTNQTSVLKLQLDLSNNASPDSNNSNTVDKNLQRENHTSVGRKSTTMHSHIDIETGKGTNKDRDGNKSIHSDIDDDFREVSDVHPHCESQDDFHEVSDVALDRESHDNLHEVSHVPPDRESHDDLHKVSHVPPDCESHDDGMEEMTRHVPVVEAEHVQSNSRHSTSDGQPKSVLRKGTNLTKDRSQHMPKHQHTVKYSYNTEREPRPRIDRQSTNQINQSSLSMIHDASVSIVMQAEDRLMPSLPVPQITESRASLEPSQKPRQETAKKHEKPKPSPLPGQNVQMWCGGKRKRRATDVIDLDIVLDVIEEVAFDYREELTTKTQRNAVRGFFREMQETITDTIDGVQEMKYLKTNITRSVSEVNSSRRELLLLRKKQKRLRQRLSMRATNKSADLLTAEAWLQQARQLEAY